MLEKVENRKVCEEGGLYGPLVCETVCANNAVCCFEGESIGSNVSNDDCSLSIQAKYSITCETEDFCEGFLLSNISPSLKKEEDVASVDDCASNGIYGPEECKFLCEGLECCWSSTDADDGLCNFYQECQKNAFCELFLSST